MKKALSEGEIRGTEVAPDDWYWIEHSTPGFNGEEGVLRFRAGKAAFSAKVAPHEAPATLRALLLCWHLNGFVVRPMAGGAKEYESWIEALPAAGDEEAPEISTDDEVIENG